MLRETTKISLVEGAALAADTMQRPEILRHGLLARAEGMVPLKMLDHRDNAHAHAHAQSDILVIGHKERSTKTTTDMLEQMRASIWKTDRENIYIYIYSKALIAP